MILNTPPEYNKYENAKRLREGLENHIRVVADKAMEKFGEISSMDILEKLLEYNEVVRFPATVIFDDEISDKCEPVRVERQMETPEEKYIIIINPTFKERERDIISLVLYSIVKINYGKIAKVKEAELFASLLLGISEDEYHYRYENLKKEIT